MQAIAIAACSVLFAFVDFAQAQDDISNSLYQKRYERLDIDTILASPRLVTNYVECLLNKKPCAPEGKALKRVLPEALRTKCGRCHPSQKEVALKVITALYFDYPQHYQALREKWDPSGEYNKRFEEYLRDQKFNSIGGSDSEPGEQAQGSSFSINTITQRPTRQGQGQNSTQAQSPGSQAQESKPSPTTTTSDDKDLPAILNRFGGDDDDGYDYSVPTSANKTNTQSTPKPSARPQPSTKPQQQPVALPATSAPTATQAPSRRPSGGSARPSQNSGGGSNPTNTWTHHNQPTPNLSATTTYYLKTQNPVLNIINRITMKFANTAEFIAGMLRGAVPQQQRS